MAIGLQSLGKTPFGCFGDQMPHKKLGLLLVALLFQACAGFHEPSWELKVPITSIVRQGRQALEIQASQLDITLREFRDDEVRNEVRPSSVTFDGATGELTVAVSGSLSAPMRLIVQGESLPHPYTTVIFPEEGLTSYRPTLDKASTLATYIAEDLLEKRDSRGVRLGRNESSGSSVQQLWNSALEASSFIGNLGDLAQCQLPPGITSGDVRNFCSQCADYFSSITPEHIEQIFADWLQGQIIDAGVQVAVAAGIPGATLMGPIFLAVGIGQNVAHMLDVFIHQHDHLVNLGGIDRKCPDGQELLTTIGVICVEAPKPQNCTLPPESMSTCSQNWHEVNSGQEMVAYFAANPSAPGANLVEHPTCTNPNGSTVQFTVCHSVPHN